MENLYDIDLFFKSFGFHKVNEIESIYFGDKLLIYSNGFLLFRIVSDKSNLSVDIKRVLGSEWFDIGIVKTLLDMKHINNNSLENYKIKDLLKISFEDIIEIFDEKNYLVNEEKLKKLEIIRSKRMFPGIN